MQRRSTVSWASIAGLAAPLAITGLAAAPAHADPDPFALSPEQLFNATVISASRIPEKARDTAAAIFVITDEDISRAGATSVPEALRLAPGVQVARINASTWAVGVRGFNGALADKLLVLVDGREVYDPLFSGVHWDVQEPPIGDIERIEIIRGPGAALWGANAVNGVINIITKPARETQGAFFSAAGGNEDRALIDARYGGRARDLDWRVFASAHERAAGVTPSGADAHDQWSSRRGGFRADWGGALTLQGDLYRSAEGDLRAVPQLGAPYASIVAEDIVTHGGDLLARWSGAPRQGERFTLQAYVDVADRDQFTLEERRTSFDLDAQYEFAPFGAHKIVAGLRARTTRDKLGDTALVDGGSEVHEARFSGFAEDRIALTPNHWRAILGAKIERNDFSGIEVQPDLRVQWLARTQTAWTSVSRAVRTPSELERDFQVDTGVVAPNAAVPLPVEVDLAPSPNFRSEQVIAYQAGYRREMGAVQASVSAFYNDYRDLATLTLLAPTLAAGPLHFVLPLATTNQTSGHTDGIEATLDWRAARGLRLSGSYSLLKMALTGPPPAQAIAATAAAGEAPRNQFNVRADWDATRKIALDGALYYVDALPGFHVPAYTRVDARAALRLSPGAELEAIGRNIFDPGHREFGAADEAGVATIGRTFLVRLTVRR